MTRPWNTYVITTLLTLMFLTAVETADSEPAPQASPAPKASPAEPTKDATADKQEPKSTPSPGELGPWEGFRGMKWGTDLKDLHGFMVVQSDDAGGKTCVKPNDHMKIGSVKLWALHYSFYNNKFFAVGMRISSDDFLRMQAFLQAKFGAPDVSSDRRGEYYWLHDLISAEGVAMMLERGKGTASECAMIFPAAGPKTPKDMRVRLKEESQKGF